MALSGELLPHRIPDAAKIAICALQIALVVPIAAFYSENKS